LLRAAETFGWQGSARTAATLNQEIVSTGAQKRGKEKGQGIRGSGSRIRRLGIDLAAVLGVFRRGISSALRRFERGKGGNGEEAGGYL
jgi:hypothetical protein